MKKANVKKCRIIVSLFITMLMLNSIIASAENTKDKQDLQDEKVSITIPVGTYKIRDTTGGQDIFVENFGRLLVPGKPNLPSKIFSLAIPPGAKVVEVNYDAGRSIVFPETYEMSPTPLPRVIGQEDPLIYERDKRRYEESFRSVYGSDEPYPQNAVEFVRSASYRRYNLVDVRVTPVRYRPLSGQLVYYPEVTVHLTCRFDGHRDDIIVDNLARSERIAQEIIFNYEQAQEWYPPGTHVHKGPHDFVIITLDALTSSAIPLVDWETSKGRNVKVVTTSWINANYSGYDLAAQIRSFLRDKYPSGEWGIEDVLLIGDYDDVPMRRTWQDVGYGQPETDFYYAELSLPDSQSWDADGDRKYGEDSDPIDFYSEVNVGRIPWSTSSTVLSICEKSVAYEQNADATFKRNILLLGAFFWNDDSYPRTDCAVLMEAKVDQPWMSDWTVTKMYEKNADCWSSYACDYPLLHNNVMSVWPTGKYAFVNWAGHGSPCSSHIYGLGAPSFIESSDCPSLNDDYPAIIFADACSNSDTDYLNIGQAMLKQGAVGFLGATKAAYGCAGWDNPYDGSSQSLDYFFTTCVTSGDYTQGEAHQWALREMYTNGLWGGGVKYQMFEWGALWGNPDLECDLEMDSPRSVRGDVAPPHAQDGRVTMVDGLMILGYYYGDTGLDCMDAGDVDDNGTVTMGDGLRALGYYYGDPGTDPEPPFPNCGGDPTADGLDCATHTYCGTKAAAPKPWVSIEGAPNKLVLQQAVTEGDILRLPVDLVISEDVLGCGFVVDYDPVQLTFAGLVGGKGYDFYRSHVVDEASGEVRVGTIPDLELKDVFVPGEHRVAELEFRVKSSVTGVEFGLDEVEVVNRSFVNVPVEWVVKTGVDKLPKEFALKQNYPNPFNPTTEIKYVLPQDCLVRLEVYNILGQKVITLIDEEQKAGYKVVHWDSRSESGNDVTSGIYFYRLQAGDFVQTRKMVVLK